MDDAKSASVYSNVNVFYYAEANRVRDAMLNGPNNNVRMINDVIPYVTNLDYLSYSSYDMQRSTPRTSTPRSTTCRRICPPTRQLRARRADVDWRIWLEGRQLDRLPGAADPRLHPAAAQLRPPGPAAYPVLGDV